MTRREEIELAWFSKEVQSNHRYDEKSFKEAGVVMTRHMIYNLCVLALQLGFAYLFRSLNMPTMVDVANLTGLSLLMLPLIGLIVPKWRNWLTKRIWER